MFITKIRVLVATLVAGIGLVAFAPAPATAAPSRETCKQWVSWADDYRIEAVWHAIRGENRLYQAALRSAAYWDSFAARNGC